MREQGCGTGYSRNTFAFVLQDRESANGIRPHFVTQWVAALYRSRSAGASLRRASHAFFGAFAPFFLSKMTPRLFPVFVRHPVSQYREGIMRVWMASVVALMLPLSHARAAQIVYETAGDVQNLCDTIAGPPPGYADTVGVPNDLLSYGDEINLGGTARKITAISIPFVLQNYPGLPGGEATPYTPNLTLTLYQDNGTLTSSSDALPNPNDPVISGIARPGTVIASSNLIGPIFEPDANYWDSEQTLTFTFPAVLVPNTFSFAVTQNNEDGSFGADLFSIDISDVGGTSGSAMPQLVGSHNGFVWEQSATTSLFEATDWGNTIGAPGYIAVQATVFAVPEPSTLWLLTTAIGAFVLTRKLRRTAVAELGNHRRLSGPLFLPRE